MSSLLPFFGVARVSGDDRATFLHGQLSNHIEQLPAQTACYATYNTPKGRVIANMLVINRGDDILLVMAEDLLESTLKRLRMFVLRAKVVFEVLDDHAAAGELPQNAQPSIAEQPQLSFPAPTENGISRVTLPHGGTVLVGSETALPAYDAEAERAWQQHEIQSGYPWISAATAEAAVAQMLNQHTIGGVHFKKGCYPGQEIIARAQYRGQVKRGLATLLSPAVQTAGTELLNDQNEEVGLIINSCPTGDSAALCLAVIKFSAAQQPLFDVSARPLNIERLFFATETEHSEA